MSYGLGREKVRFVFWWELQAMAWNRPEHRDRIARVHASWCDAMREAVAAAGAEYRLESGPLGADEWVTLIVALNEGIILERLSGIERGHEELLSRIDRWLSSLEREGGGGENVRGWRRLPSR